MWKFGGEISSPSVIKVNYKTFTKASKLDSLFGKV